MGGYGPGHRRCSTCGPDQLSMAKQPSPPVLDAAHLTFRMDAARAFSAFAAGPAGLGLEDGGSRPGGGRWDEGAGRVAEGAPPSVFGSSGLALELAKVSSRIQPLLTPHGIDADAESFEAVLAVPGLLGEVLEAAIDEVGGAGGGLRARGLDLGGGVVTRLGDLLDGLGKFELASAVGARLNRITDRVMAVAVKRDSTTGAYEGWYYPGEEREEEEEPVEQEMDCSGWWQSTEGCSDDQNRRLANIRSYLEGSCGDIPLHVDEGGLDYWSAFAAADAKELVLRCNESEESCGYLAQASQDSPAIVEICPSFFDTWAWAGTLRTLGIETRRLRAGILLHEAAHTLQFAHYGSAFDDWADVDPFPSKLESCHRGSTSYGGPSPFHEANAAYVQYRYYGLGECAAQAAACGYSRLYTEDYAVDGVDDSTADTNKLRSYAIAVFEILTCYNATATPTLVALVVAILSTLLLTPAGDVVSYLLDGLLVLLGATILAQVVLSGVFLRGGL